MLSGCEMNTMQYKQKYSWLIVLAISIMACLLTACGSSGSGSTGSTNASATTTSTGSTTNNKVTSLGAASTPTTTTSSGNTITGAGDIGAPIKQIRMINANEGWALTADNLFKTEDGGKHWSNRGPSNKFITLKNPVGTFMSSQIVWLVAQNVNGPNPNTFQVFRTLDGGMTWQTWPTGTLTTSNDEWPIDSPHFVNTQDGWIEFTIGGPGAGSEPVEIFHTTDGGVHWTKQTGLPSGGLKSGISFQDPTNGWATGLDYSDQPWLYVTHDSGNTWNRVSLPGISGMTYRTTPPVFFGKDGFMPVTTNGQTLMFATSDSGQTWVHTGTANFEERSIYIPTINTGWAVDNNGVVYSTSDGGHHWTNLGNPGHTIQSFSSIDSQTGWAVADQGKILLQTTDGGHTWHVV
jgi:photosystem II stability/assembly factor-like uncharacterized protein